MFIWNGKKLAFNFLDADMMKNLVMQERKCGRNLVSTKRRMQKMENQGRRRGV